MKMAYFILKEGFNMSQLPARVGASSTLFTHDRPANPRRSKFDISRITNFTAEAGMIIPFDWVLGLPGDDFVLNILLLFLLHLRNFGFVKFATPYLHFQISRGIFIRIINGSTF